MQGHSLIFVDEPTRNLVSSEQFIVLEALRAMTNQDSTVIAAFHEPSSLVFEAVDSVMILENGFRVFHGSPKSAVRYFTAMSNDARLDLALPDVAQSQVSDNLSDPSTVASVGEKGTGTSATNAAALLSHIASGRLVDNKGSFINPETLQSAFDAFQGTKSGSSTSVVSNSVSKPSTSVMVSAPASPGLKGPSDLDSSGASLQVGDTAETNNPMQSSRSNVASGALALGMSKEIGRDTIPAPTTQFRHNYTDWRTNLRILHILHSRAWCNIWQRKKTVVRQMSVLIMFGIFIGIVLKNQEGHVYNTISFFVIRCAILFSIH